MNQAGPSTTSAQWLNQQLKAPRRAVTCVHKYVNVGFHHERLACKHCDLDKPSPHQTAWPSPPREDEVVALPPQDIRFVEVPLLRGFSEVSALFELSRRHDAVIAGGYARFCASPRVQPRRTDDLDVFPGRVESARGLVVELRERGFSVAKDTPFSTTLRPPSEHPGDTPESMRWKTFRKQVQVIKVGFVGKGWRGVGEFHGLKDLARQVLSTFDMSVVRAAIIAPDIVIADEAFWRDERDRRMRIDGFRNASFLLHRLAKYRQRGYHCNAQEVQDLYRSHANGDVHPATVDEVCRKIEQVINEPYRFSDLKASCEDSGEGFLPASEETSLGF